MRIVLRKLELRLGDDICVLVEYHEADRAELCGGERNETTAEKIGKDERGATVERADEEALLEIGHISEQKSERISMRPEVWVDGASPTERHPF